MIAEGSRPFFDHPSLISQSYWHHFVAFSFLFFFTPSLLFLRLRKVRLLFFLLPSFYLLLSGRKQVKRLKRMHKQEPAWPNIALKYVDRLLLCSSETWIDRFWGSKGAICLVGRGKRSGLRVEAALQEMIARSLLLPPLLLLFLLHFFATPACWARLELRQQARYVPTQHCTVWVP